MVSRIPNCEALEKSSCDNSGRKNGIATIMIHERTIRRLAHEYHYNIKFDAYRMLLSMSGLMNTLNRLQSKQIRSRHVRVVVILKMKIS